MNSLINSSPQELINNLKLRKNELMNEEQQTRKKIKQFYTDLRSRLQGCQKQTNADFSRQVLRYYEKSAQVIKSITKKQDSTQIDFAQELLQYKINASPSIGLNMLELIIKKSFPVTISNKAQPTLHEILGEFLQEETIIGTSGNASEIVIQKLQCERDYYQRRQQDLKQKIRQLQTHFQRRGVNIKEMSKTYLEEKCSKWALERLQQQKKILVERIGQASQQIIRLNSQNGQLQHELRKAYGNVNDSNSKSMVMNGTVVKGYSVVGEETNKHEKILQQEEEQRQRQLQLQIKNQELMIEVTRCLKQIHEMSQSTKIMENRIQQDETKIFQLQQSIQSLKLANESLNHDYEISLKRKATFQQECRELKSELMRMNQIINEERQAYKHLVNELENKQEEVLARVKDIQENKKIQIQKYERKIQGLTKEKQKIAKMFEDASTKKGEQINYKALLNEQISRLLKENNGLSQELELKEHQIFQFNTTSRETASNLKKYEKKAQQNKKEMLKYKKVNKELQKQILDYQRKSEQRENIEIKIAHLEQNYSILSGQFARYKESSDRKSGIHDKTIGHLKEKFTFQLSSLMNQDSKPKNKKRTDLIEKYIEELITWSAKTAQIKQLKDQIRQLKDGKQSKSQSKKNKTSTMEETVSTVQGGVLSLGAKIIEERLKADKACFQQTVKQMSELISKEQIMKITLEEQLEKERAYITELKSKQKQEANSEETSKKLKQKQQKIERLENQLKVARTNARKLQNDNNQLDSELKTKKQLSIGLKKQCKEKDDLIKQMTVQLELSQDEVEKLKRNQKEANKKQNMFKDIKERKEQVNEENTSLKKTIESLEDKIKLLNKQIAKKDECLKDLRNFEQREVKIKQEGKIKQTLQTIASQKETIRKLKSEIDRKDQIIKNTKEKVETKVKLLEGKALSKEKQSDKAKKQVELFERKIETIRTSCKREENKNYILTMLIKKIFELCVSVPKQQTPRMATTAPRQSIHFYSSSTLTPHQVKSNVTSSNVLKSSQICQGLKILDLKPEDLQGFLGQTTISSKVSHNPQTYQENSWTMVSPIAYKSNQSLKQDQLVSGLEQLEKQLGQKDVNSGSVLDIFRRNLRAQ